MCLSPWTYLGATLQTIGEDKEDNKETGGSEDPHKGIKDGWPKAWATTLTMPVSIMDRLDTSPETVLKDERWGPNLTLLILTMKKKEQKLHLSTQ